VHLGFFNNVDQKRGGIAKFFTLSITTTAKHTGSLKRYTNRLIYNV